MVDGKYHVIRNNASVLRAPVWDVQRDDRDDARVQAGCLLARVEDDARHHLMGRYATKFVPFPS